MQITNDTHGCFNFQTFYEIVYIVYIETLNRNLFSFIFHLLFFLHVGKSIRNETSRTSEVY